MHGGVLVPQQRNVCICRVSEATPRPHGKLLQRRGPGMLKSTSVRLLRSAARAMSGLLDCQDSEGSTATLFHSFAAQPGPPPVRWIPKTQRAQQHPCSSPSQRSPPTWRRDYRNMSGSAGFPRVRGLSSNSIPHVLSAALPSRLKD